MTKVAVVFGGKTDGNGKGAAERLEQDGYEIRSITQADGLDGIEIEDDGSVKADMSKLDSVIQAARHLGVSKPSAIVFADIYFNMENNAEFEHNLWEKSIAVNLTAPNVLFREIAPYVPDGSSFVVVTSTEAFVGSFGASAYAATKAAIHNLVKSLANVFGNRGIRFNAVAAGWIGGVMDTDEVFNMSRKITPLGRLGSTAEVGAAVSFLVGRDASFVNGSVLVVDGGYSGVDTISKYEYESSLKEE